jgi:methionyl-tRNA formyltransferase
MNLVFCGTPQFAVPTLQKIIEAGHDVRLVVTQTDKPSGRGLEMAVSPVKRTAREFALEIAQPDKIKNNEEFRRQLESLKPDAIIVVGYGRIIPQWMIDLPPLGNINLHASLLPKYRGAAPIQWAVASGDAVTGVTTMRIDAGLDTGDILQQREERIEFDDTAETLAPRLAKTGAELMVETLVGLERGTIQAIPQDHGHATLAPILTKEDGLVNFQRSAAEVYNRLRGFQPWPGAYTIFRGKQFQIRAAKPLKPGPSIEPGELLASGNRLLVGCGDNTGLELLEIQLEGKKRMPAADFIRGYRLIAGERLGS